MDKLNLIFACSPPTTSFYISYPDHPLALLVPLLFALRDDSLLQGLGGFELIVLDLDRSDPTVDEFLVAEGRDDLW